MSRPTVLLTMPLPDPAHAILEPCCDVTIIGDRPTETELADLVRNGVDILVPQLVDPVTEVVLSAAGPRLRAVSLYAAGYNNVDVAAATRHGIVVANTPDVLTEATADLTLALVLAVQRRLIEGDRELRAGRFTGWRPDYLLGTHSSGQVLGLAGFGRIGQSVARRALALGMHVIFTRRPDKVHAPPSTATELPADLVGRVQEVAWYELLQRSDVVSVHVPLTDRTHHLIDAETLAAMKSTSILINTARGPIVDEQALAEGLHHGVIHGAGLDVFEREPEVAPRLLTAPNTVLLPHLGSATVSTRSAMAEMCARNAVEALRGRLPGHVVNPGAWLHRDLTDIALCGEVFA